MKILILSDLHLEFEEMDVDSSGVDLIILAGDINVKKKGLNWAKDYLIKVPVLYILGNHEFFGKAYPKLVTELKEDSVSNNVYILERDVYTNDGVNFLGCTLWTDFELFGDARIAGYKCQEVMTDFKRIRLSPSFSKIRPIDFASIHRKSLSWLKEELIKRKGQRNIVITHHAPSIKSIPEEYKEDTVSSAFASNLEHIALEHSPLYWIHGHTHNSSNYFIGKTHVISNPRGYPDDRNPNFNPRYIVEL